jgi:hypothetical protein
MKKSLLVLGLIFGVTQVQASERIVLDIFIPLTVCTPVLKPAPQLKKCEI